MTLLDQTPVDDEESVEAPGAAAAPDTTAFHALVERLSRQSVDKHFDAYLDIPWDDPAYAIDPADPRWSQVTDSLAETDWFRSLPPEKQSELGLYLVAGFMKIGVQFESVLKRGLLEYAVRLDNGDPTFRYAYHEVIEEGQHSLMFQEFVNRTGFPLRGLGWFEQRATRRIVGMARWFPELFFMFVLGGEDPIDHVQRESLRSDRDIPPVLERIMRIHVTEEARHLSFARHYLKLQAAEMGRVKRTALGIGTPLILGAMAQLMMRPSPSMIRRFDIPRATIREAYTRNPEHAAKTRLALRKVRRLSRELGIVNGFTRKIWQGLGIWDED